MNKKAVLLINLGTPDSADPASVRRYLREFLSDPHVIDLPWLIRWPLVNLCVIPFRFKKTAAAYQKIWGVNGSPLLINTQRMQAVLAEKLGEDYQVALGMRYGKPSIQDAVQQLKNCESIIVIPLFPQYSSVATGSAIEKLMSVIRRQWNKQAVTIIHDFYDHPAFITAIVNKMRHSLNDMSNCHILFSYHGLPVRHMTKSACYREQCYATSHAIAHEADLKESHYTIASQSRLGRTPWIRPYTDDMLVELRQKGVKNIAIVCPSFVADCLETLEEINIRAKEQWHSLGGNRFTYIPCVNDSFDLSSLIPSI